MIRLLSTEDVPAVTDMVKNSFAPALWPFMTYAQRGIGRFLEVALRYPLSVEPRFLIVATDESSDAPIGFADFTIRGDGVGFLSYICVDPAARGKGVATMMFDRFLAEHPHLTTVKLDTFRDNSAARALYARWGFTVESASCWVTRALPHATDPLPISALAVSLAAYEVYGFCELNVVSSERPVRVGLMGDRVLRCFDRATFEDDAILGGVSAVFGRLDTAFAVVAESEVHEILTPHDVLLVSDRMSLALDEGRPTR
ncbi:GNAT family N-acetyltransferase [Diaminobutyricibacter tongyongensis]|uniref:GNAT family N-acetyltransferase n=1 Tax=Leifsonia tongyongensis TaxID=1268043 RepID=A0A6L9XVK7_9MICO|nr:GNAT family N-acetyltransferase [Diaminobutyricibacter tongyongensis]NEN05462.1 GNAT family N-acetyltransferase [Diaminobutyricibacter tongyongensis]